MRRRSTKLKIVFFSVLLAGLIVIQYSYIRTLRKEKLQHFKSRLITCLARTGEKIAFNSSKDVLTNSELANLLQQSFSSKGLGDLRFEYLTGSDNKQLASRGFSEKLKADPGNLVLYFELPPYSPGTHDNSLTLVVPQWKNIALKEMSWIIATAVVFTLMILAIFYFAIILGDRRQQLFYEKREKIIQYMMQQLETPLSTVSVATEALRNTNVMQDTSKTNYYQQIINEENKRMREQVEKFLRELK